jgi:hypothetical protein
METLFGRMPIDLPTLRDAARRELRAQVAAATDDLSTAILERLAANEPVTSLLLFFAVRSGDSPLSSSAERRIELRLAAEIEATFQAKVDEFCRKFFELEPESRRDRWIVLRRRTSASPALTARLEELSRGLDVDCRALSGQRPAVQRLAALVREFFVLPPLERAVQRREWLASHAAEAKSLQPAAWRLARRFPMTANLDPVFLERLRRPGPRLRWRRPVRIFSRVAKQHAVDKFIDSRPWTSIGIGVATLIFGVVVSLINQSSTPRSGPIQPLPQFHYPAPFRLLPNTRNPKKPPQSQNARPTPKKPGSGP